MRKPSRIRALGSVETAPLRAALERLSERAWRRHDAVKENGYWCFESTRHLVFRFIRGNRDARNFYSERGWPVFRPLLEPLLEQASAPYGLARPVFPKVMLAKLLAGGTIGLHRDGEGSHPYTHKIHVPLETNPQAELEVDGEAFHLEAGQAYELNNLAPHGARNEGSRDRVHLIFEVFDAPA